jgi:hypothetical protein
MGAGAGVGVVVSGGGWKSAVMGAMVGNGVRELVVD